ncbi:hypothetical protein [Ferroacidibacillus organovorans]|uniref:Uncharacterized protein n=2 Tax=Ferroacidibacillus organovorans TaxID=1765683 RepID=A0A1V4ERY3_9BACL|nr:hypothetical protein [Ferroacidibacillus organovorans]OAG94421.1 hypothetical protein AYW79_05235 [Ferroacidibacillus organovorans]OPG15693.1 hypothetical protein B2M26_11615 [Ferroacidibacillus organovorans]
MDFCCGTTMTARLAPLYSEGGVLLTDVPFLFCHTCHTMRVAPQIFTEVTLYTHHCETDGLKRASLFDILASGQIDAILAMYPGPDPSSKPYVTEAQIDHLLDVWNVAQELGDVAWIDEVRKTLCDIHALHLNQTRDFQNQQ